MGFNEENQCQKCVNRGRGWSFMDTQDTAAYETQELRFEGVMSC